MGSDMGTEQDTWQARLAGLEISDTDYEAIKAALVYRLEFERLITSLSTQFINLPINEIDSGINQALETVCKFTAVDRGGLFLFSSYGTRFDGVYEYCAPEVESQIVQLVGQSADDYPWLIESIKRGQTLNLSGLSDLPAIALAEQEALQARGIQSLVCIPIIYGGTALGFLSFEMISRERPWSDENINLYRLVGEMFAHTLERRWTEDALKQLSRQNQLILDSTAEGILGLDAEGKITFVNPAAARMTGWDMDELLDRSQHELLHHSRADGTIQTWENCRICDTLHSGTVHYATDEVFWRKNGTHFPVKYRSAPIYEQGELVGGVVTFEDITQQKRAELALRASDAKFRALLKTSADAIVIADHAACISLVNDRTETMFGYQRDELLGKPVEILISEELRPNHVRSRDIYAKSPQHYEINRGFQLIAQRKDGSQFPAEIKLNPAPVETGYFTITIIRDISDQQALLTENRQLQEMLATVQGKLADLTSSARSE